MEKSRTLWSVILPSLLGLVSGLAGASIAVISSGYTERNREIAAEGVASYVQMTERHFTMRQDPKGEEGLRARSSFTVFAKATTLKRYGDFQRCWGENDSMKDCKDEWATLIQSMRTDIGLEPGSKEDIIHSIWRPDK